MIMMSRHKSLYGYGLLCCLITQLMLFSSSQSYYHPHDNIKNTRQHGRSDIDNVHEVLEDILQSKLSSYDNPYDEAYWYETLGYAYRMIYEKETSFLRHEINIISTTDDRDSNELLTVEGYIEQSIQAYLKAFSIYNGLLAEYKVEYEHAYNKVEENDIMYDINIVRVHIAATLFDIGEVYSTSIKSNHLAYDYYVQSSDFYIKLIQEYTTEMNEKNDIDTLSLPMSDRIEIEISHAICSVRIGSILLQEETKLNNNQQILSDQLLNLDPSILGTKLMDMSNMLNLDGTNNIEDTISQILGKNPKDMEQMIMNEIKALLLLDGNEPHQQHNNIDQKSFQSLYPKSDKAYKYFQNSLQILQKYQMYDNDNMKMKSKSNDASTNIDEMDIINRVNDNNNVEEETRLKMSMRRLVSDSEFDMKRYMAICLQSMATIETLQNDLLKATKHYEESLEIYNEILDMNNNNNNNDIIENDQSSILDNDTIFLDIQISVGEILLYLADIYLQQGKYDDSKDRYKRTMEWLEEYEIPAQTIMQQKEKVTMDIDKTLTEYERLLHEYERMFGENSMDGGAGGGKVVLDDGGFFDEDIHEDSYITQPFEDEGYEGDLHASLGSLYMSKNDYIAASSHYMQAIRLYELNGEQNERSMADVKFNLATLYLHLHDFASSFNEYSGALDLYHQILGDNVNPMSPSLKLKETLEAFGIDESLLTDITSSSLFGSLFGEENIDGAYQAGSKINQALQALMHEKQQHYEVGENNKGVGPQTDPKSQNNEDTLSKKTTFDPSSKKTRDIHESNKLYTQQNINLPDGTVVDLKNFLHQNNSIKEEL